MPPRTADRAGHREGGTASVELVAVVPFLLLAVLAAVQIALAGQALWSAGVAARAGARAALVGEGGDGGGATGAAAVAAERLRGLRARARSRCGCRCHASSRACRG